MFFISDLNGNPFCARFFDSDDAAFSWIDTNDINTNVVMVCEVY